MIRAFDIIFFKLYSPFVAIFGLFFGTHYGLAFALPYFASVPFIGWLNLLVALTLIVAGVMFTIITFTKFWS